MTDQVWERIQHLLPDANTFGRPRGIGLLEALAQLGGGRRSRRGVEGLHQPGRNRGGRAFRHGPLKTAPDGIDSRVAAGL